MLPDLKFKRPVRYAMLACAALTLCACANMPLLMPYPHNAKAAAKTPPAQPKPSPQELTQDLTLLQQWFEAPATTQASQLVAADAAYRSTGSSRDALHLALLLGIPGGANSDLPRAQKLLEGLVQDPTDTLLPTERTLAQFALTFISNRLTLTAESRTLQTGGAAKLAKLKAQLTAASDQNVALRRQLEQARAKLAAIANIEKSLNEGKLGTEGPPK